MSQWLLENFPGMILSSMLESAAVTLVVYLLCTVSVFYSSRLGVKLWQLLALFVVVLFVQGLISLSVQVTYPSTDALDAVTLTRVLVSPVVISILALLVFKARARRTYS